MSSPVAGGEAPPPMTRKTKRKRAPGKPGSKSAWQPPFGLHSWKPVKTMCCGIFVAAIVVAVFLTGRASN